MACAISWCRSAAAAHAVAPGVDCVIVVVRARGTIGFATGDLPLEGALLFRRGIFRQRGPCVMEDPAAERFCAACTAVIEAGRPTAPPAEPPRLALAARASADAPREAELTHAERAGTSRVFALLLSLESEASDAELAERFLEAHARVSR